MAAVVMMGQGQVVVARGTMPNMAGNERWYQQRAREQAERGEPPATSWRPETYIWRGVTGLLAGWLFFGMSVGDEESLQFLLAIVVGFAGLVMLAIGVISKAVEVGRRN